MRTAMALLMMVSLQACFGCTLMYAPSGVALELVDGDWPAGTWEIELNGYNQFAMCVVTLPLGDGVISCTANATLELDAAGVPVALRTTEFAPESFRVERLHDGVFVDDQDFAPTYETSEPNGKGCGVRKLASLEWDLG